jgi:hypothetical protein
VPERTCGAVVETVRVAVPEPFVTELGLNEQEGNGVTEGAIVLQDRFTIPLKPFIGMTVIVEVAEVPAETVAGERVEAAIVKSATRVAVTVKLTVVLWFTDPAPAITVTV